MHAFIKQAFGELDAFSETIRKGHIKQHKFNITTVRLLQADDVNVALPGVIRVDFNLQSCRLKGKGCKTFTLHGMNTFIILTTTPAVLSVHDWSVCILHGGGEIMSMSIQPLGIQVTYRVKAESPTQDNIYVSIQFQGMCVFAMPVEICRAVFENTGQLAFSLTMPGINVNNYYRRVLKLFDYR